MSKKTDFLILVSVFLILPLLLINGVGLRKLNQHRYDRLSLKKIQASLGKLALYENENQAIAKKHLGACSSYIHQSLESTKLASNDTLEFVEKQGETAAYYSDKIETLTKPVQLNFEEVQKLILLIEKPKATTSSPPHLIITNLSLKKRGASIDSPFFLNLELLKREYFR